MTPSAPPGSRGSRLVLSVSLLAVVGLLAAGALWWYQSQRLPEPGSDLYERYVQAFQVGEAAADTDQPDLARERLQQAIALVPAEPAAHADLGLLELRNGNLDAAATHLAAARRLAPESAEIEAMYGHLAKARGKYTDAAAHFRKALAQRPNDLQLLYALAQTVEQEAKADADAEYQKLIEKGLQVEPNNLRLLRERASTAIRRGDRAALDDTLARYRKLSAGWSKTAVAALDEFEQKAKKPLEPDLVNDLTVLDNLLKPETGYVRSAKAVDPDQKAVGDMVEGFLRLQPVRPTPAPADLGLTYDPPESLGEARAWIVVPVWLESQKPPAIFVANGKEVRRPHAVGPALPFPGGPKDILPTANGVVAFDWNNDLRPDLLLAGAGGLRFYQGGDDGAFTDVTAKTTLPADVLNGDYFGAWAVDIEMDGDLDIVVAPSVGPPLVLRNNGDGTWKVLKLFAGVENVRAFAWADFDHDGAADAAFVDDKGKLYVFANERMGQFRARPLPTGINDGEPLLALAVADVTDDGQLDLIGLRVDGELFYLADQDKGQSWTAGAISRGIRIPDAAAPGSVRLLAVDLDNNGAVDFLASAETGSIIWLASGMGQYTVVPSRLPDNIFAAVDRTGDGFPDLLAVDDGRAVQCNAKPTKGYKSLVVWPKAAERVPRGDSRINSRGIGGTVEVRTGRLVRKVPIAGPEVRLGLGDAPQAQVVRIEWPNGTFQVEFEVPFDKAVVVEQRLKGSCPFLFADDGTGVKFVTDFLWSAPLGMYINGQDQGGFAQTTDWVKIRGDQLAERAGWYDLRVNANLWETHFFDQAYLKVVDHPPGTEAYIDERFFLTPTAPRVYVTRPSKPVARAWDHEGRDVTDIVRAVDGRYLDAAGRGQYQGLTRDHWVEFDLGDDAPSNGPLYLLATGWIHPTDSSLNVAISQGSHPPPSPLVLELPDGHGGWKAVGPPLGFPAGKNKTVVVRLDGLAGAGVARRFRLRTNLEIFWDRLAWAPGLDDQLARVQDLAPETADLRYRGVLAMTQADASSPDLPDYDRVISRRQYWRDLIGYHTRFGDVRELLAKVDDRYVIMNAGDEIAFRFRAPPAPPAGWRRDFVWVADGWEKDGDYNTRCSKTVLPLPFHGQTRYGPTPGRLEDDPVFRRFPDDWRKFHTRWVTPAEFERGLRPDRQSNK